MINRDALRVTIVRSIISVRRVPYAGLIRPVDWPAPVSYNRRMSGSAPGYRNMDRFFIQLKAGERLTLSAALQRHLRTTREEAERLLRQGSVWDHDRQQRLRDGDALPGGRLLRVDRPKFSVREYVLDPADVKHEDDHLLVVFKRGGVPTQPTPYSDVSDLLHGVQGYLGRRGVAYRPAPVNRLDLPAQGLVLFAKDKRSETALHRLFDGRQVRKRYLAATAPFAGAPASCVIRSRLEWQGREKEALTYVRFCRERGGRFFFLVLPQSGRTHQIRRHFQERLAPLLGDVRYGGAAPGNDLWLLCFQYAFVHPATRERFSVRYIPSAWREAMGLKEE
jgi:23S rRNA pseudouridine1911/1915/1917 synthase